MLPAQAEASVSSAPVLNTPGLSVSALRKSFGGVTALQGVDAEAHPGEVHGLIGENGAGKSTLVKILTGVLEPDGGEIWFQGRRMVFKSPRTARDARIAVAFQDLSLVPDWDVATNLLYGTGRAFRAGRASPRELRRQAVEEMESLGVRGIDPARPVRDLALFERQILEIARALMLNPQLLILDEPTSALPPEQVTWFSEAVRLFVKGDRLVLFVSHRLEEIRALCDRVTVLRDGRAVGTGSIDEMPESRLLELMLGEVKDSLAAHERPQRRRSASRTVLKLVQFGVPPAVVDVDLELRAGEIVGVAGLEGQGQLDLFLALYGVRQSTGRMELDGRVVRPLSPANAMRDGIGLLPQDRGLALCLPLSVRDNVSLGNLQAVSRYGLMRMGEEKSLVRRVIATLRVRLRNPLQPLITLSGGNQQKILVGRVLEAAPRVLLMYDATRGVDVGTKAEIFELIRELGQSKKVATLLYSTELPEIVTMCDRVIVMRDGGIRAELVGEDVSEDRIIAAAMGGGPGEQRR